MPQTPLSAGLSACIIAFNEADRIGDCIKSLQFCDDIVVVDSHSTDDTAEIARSLGARVVHENWRGYRSQKQFAIAQARHEWVLCIDADERISEELQAEISALRQHSDPQIKGWSIPRRTDYFGRFLNHGNAYPDRLVRLFNRRTGHWAGYEVHEHVDVDGPVGTLQEHLEHFSYRSIDEHYAKLNRYAQLMAQQMHAAGRRARFSSVLINPAWRFIRGMLIKRGIQDGWRGLVFHLIEASYVRRKYLQLWVLTRLQPTTRPSNPPINHAGTTGLSNRSR